MTNSPLATAPATINFPLNQSGSQIAGLINGVTSRLDTDEANISSNTTAINNNTAAITALQNQMATANNNISTLQSQMTTANSNIAALQTSVNTMQSQISTLQSQVATIQSQITTLQNQTTDLETRMGTAESNIGSLQVHNNTQDQSIADLESRVSKLEQGGVIDTSGPFVGDLVHVTDEHGHCQPAICYEDWDGKNAAGTISVAVLSPVRLSESPWDSYIEVHQRGSYVEPPFSTWHWPEMAFTHRRDLFRRIAERAG